MALGLAIIGAGAWSLDRVLGLTRGEAPERRGVPVPSH
jgi:hypothetical protein